MGTICSSQDVASLEDQTKRRNSLTHKLEMNSPIFSEPSQSFYSDYKLHVRPINVGPYSETSKCYKRSNNKLRSVKTCSKFQFSSSIIDDRSIFEHFDTVKQLEISNSIKLYQVYESKDSFYVVQEHIPEGSLRDKLEEGHLSEQVYSKILKQVINFMINLQQLNFSSYDILPQNILISNLENWQIKINLFCFRYFIEEEYFLRHFKNQEIWNLASLLWLILTGEKLSKDSEITKERNWASLSPACQDLMIKLMNCEISIGEALDHPWIINSV